MIAQGSQAPLFSLVDQSGNQFSLESHRGKFVVLFFYPKDLTPGCTIESCSFRDEHAELLRANAIVVGIGGGTEDSKVRFATKYALNFPLLNDLENKVAKEYGVFGEKSFLGKKYMGLNRVTYLVSPKGEIAYVWEKVKPIGHAKEVLDKIKEMG